MTQILYSNQTIRITIPSGQSIAISTASGSYSAYIVNGFYKDTVLATNSTTGAVFGAYINGGAVVELSVSNDAIVSYDVGVSPVLTFKPDTQYSLDANGDVNGFIAPDGSVIGLVSTASLAASSGASLVGYLPPDGNPTATTVANRLALLDGISPSTTGTDGNVAAAVNSLRDASAVTGGTPGYVNAGIWNRSITGASETSFEWGIVGVLDNYSTDGENVAIYGQGNKRGVGATWGGCFEARDFTHTNNPTKGLVGIECDTFGNGTDGNNQRVGVDVSIGRDDGAGSIMETGFGVRVGALNSSLAEGRVIRAFATGVVEFDCAFDSSLGTQSASGVAFRMAVGQKLSFAASNDRIMLYSGGVLAYQVSGITKHTISDTGATDQTGTVSINGAQVVTARRTGYTNAMSGTADRSTAYDTSTITLVQLAQRVKAIEDDLLTHGLIGA